MGDLRSRIVLGGLATMAMLAGGAFGQTAPVEPTRVETRSPPTMRPEIRGTFGIVAAGRVYTVAAGTQMLTQGGNAIDAGVASVFAASVTEISHFGLGGEAPVLIYNAKTRKVIAISGQGTAPAEANPQLFRDKKMTMVPGNGPLGGTLPAVVDSLALALENGGTMRLEQVLQPAIAYADGFAMYAFLRDFFVSEQKKTEQWEWSKRTYYPDGKIPAVGEIFRQPNLAKTLRTIAAADHAAFEATHDRIKAIEAGRDAFYKGEIAHHIADADQKDGGVITYDDLSHYRGEVGEPTTTKFYGYDVYKTGPWGQGPALLEALNILEAAHIKDMKPDTAPYIHTAAEAINLAFDDRNAYFGDPRFVKMPLAGLLSKAYAADRAKQILPEASVTHRVGDPYAFDPSVKRTGPTYVPHAIPATGEKPGDTTSVQVVDKDGNLFSATPSSGWILGGAYIAGDTGVPLSNRMTVFDLDDNSPNVVAGGKRPRTTLTPTVVLKDGKPYLAIGTPGGDNQEQQILNVLLRVLCYDTPLQFAIEQPRFNSLHFHSSFAEHQDEPGVLEIEDRVPADVRSQLTSEGHKLKVLGPYAMSTGIVAVGVDPIYGTLRGGADVRRERYAFGW
jgi:gamma-glutamyltranspeptidase/glutathione hydrolase